MTPDELMRLLEQKGASALESIALSGIQLRSLLAELLADYHYAGYIKRQAREVQRLNEQEAKPLPTDLDYTTVSGLRREAQLVLNQFKPATLGQAGRLEGVNPADLMVISVFLNKHAQTA
jgi:tRNA U34 5-carboxymethylaminomethyl modifying enzyme MnmG/GidA